MVFLADDDIIPVVTPFSEANSYITIAEFKNYVSINFTDTTDLPTEDSAIASLIWRSLAYIESHTNRWLGQRTYPRNAIGEDTITQKLSFPRIGILVDGLPILSTTVPDEIKEAQALCALQIHSGYDPLKSINRDEVKSSENIANVVITGFDSDYVADIGASDYLVGVDALLLPFLRPDNLIG